MKCQRSRVKQACYSPGAMAPAWPAQVLLLWRLAQAHGESWAARAGGILLESTGPDMKHTALSAESGVKKVNSPSTSHQPVSWLGDLLASRTARAAALWLSRILLQLQDDRCGRGVYHGFVIGGFCSCVVAPGFYHLLFLADSRIPTHATRPSHHGGLPAQMSAALFLLRGLSFSSFRFASFDVAIAQPA
jgi:hypothetical protein